MIGVGAKNSNDEVTRYQIDRYVSSNEAIWRILSFAIHERYPTVDYLIVTPGKWSELISLLKTHYNELIDHHLQH